MYNDVYYEDVLLPIISCQFLFCVFSFLIYGRIQVAFPYFDSRYIKCRQAQTRQSYRSSLPLPRGDCCTNKKKLHIQKISLLVQLSKFVRQFWSKVSFVFVCTYTLCEREWLSLVCVGWVSLVQATVHLLSPHSCCCSCRHTTTSFVKSAQKSV